MNSVDFEDSLLEASMRIIVQPLMDECDKFISECENDDIEVPEKLKKEIHNALVREKLSRIRKIVVRASKACRSCYNDSFDSINGSLCKY